MLHFWNFNRNLLTAARGNLLYREESSNPTAIVQKFHGEIVFDKNFLKENVVIFDTRKIPTKRLPYEAISTQWLINWLRRLDRSGRQVVRSFRPPRFSTYPPCGNLEKLHLHCRIYSSLRKLGKNFSNIKIFTCGTEQLPVNILPGVFTPQNKPTQAE